MIFCNIAATLIIGVCVYHKLEQFEQILYSIKGQDSSKNNCVQVIEQDDPCVREEFRPIEEPSSLNEPPLEPPLEEPLKEAISLNSTQKVDLSALISESTLKEPEKEEENYQGLFERTGNNNMVSYLYTGTSNYATLDNIEKKSTSLDNIEKKSTSFEDTKSCSTIDDPEHDFYYKDVRGNPVKCVSRKLICLESREQDTKINRISMFKERQILSKFLQYEGSLVSELPSDTGYTFYPIYVSMGNQRLSNPRKNYSENIIGISIRDNDFDTEKYKPSAYAVVEKIIDIGGQDFYGRAK